MFSHLKAFSRRDLRCFLLCAYIELSLPGFRRFLGFFFNTYDDCFQHVLIETGDICIPSLEDEDLTDILFELACYFQFCLIATTVPTAVSLLIADRHPEG